MSLPIANKYRMQQAKIKITEYQYHLFIRNTWNIITIYLPLNKPTYEQFIILFNPKFY